MLCAARQPLKRNEALYTFYAARRSECRPRARHAHARSQHITSHVSLPRPLQAPSGSPLGPL
eukprot:8738752-Pyramimonas_sp.AAC.1